MFDIGWSEMLVIAIVMIVVVGPKDLPRMLRTFGKTTAKLRTMAGDFQRQFNEALKEAELDDVKKSVDALRSLNPATEIKKQLNPFEQAAADVRSGLDTALKPSPSPVPPASDAAQPAEPLKTGAEAVPAMPAEAAPTASQPESAKKAAAEAATVKAKKPAAAKAAASATPKAAASKPAAKVASKATTKKPAKTAAPADKAKAAARKTSSGSAK
ncbi:Sec-independent protein translocase protein TatB [Mesorhizobium sp. KR2-14]|uniref:Sec-independent protein translocase protein TatB n=1 Tax=Mesorhizobium sp. KR2-14 TaxID=3156610 RepID=UPI0032B3FF9D